MQPQSSTRSCHENIKTLNFAAQIAVADIFSKPYTSPMKSNHMRAQNVLIKLTAHDINAAELIHKFIENLKVIKR
jgi:hypothetical protein